MDLEKIEYFSDYEQYEIDLLVSKYINEQINANEFSKIFYEQPDYEVTVYKLEHKTLRLLQSLINLLDTEKLLNIEKYRLLLSIKNKSEPFDIDQFIALIDMYVNPELDPEVDKLDQYWTKHRNVCFILVIVLRFLQLHKDKQVNLPSETTYSQIMEYLMKIIKESDNVETRLYAVTATLNMCLLYLDHWRLLTDCERLSSLLESLAMKKDDACPLELLYSGVSECIKYQTAFQAFWCLDLLTKEQGERPSSEIKLSPNKLSARNDELYNLPSIHCPLWVNTNVFFYEVVLLTTGEMRLGWISGTSSSKCLGTDLYSLGLDGYNRRLWHNQVDQPVKSMACWKCGDVIGLLIDFNLESFSFYLNGEMLDLGHAQIHFSSLPYFASVSLAVNQQCYFNFGQSPFKHPPPNYQLLNFYTASDGLLHTMSPLVLEAKLITVNWYALKGFRDGLQEEYDKLITMVENFVAKNTFGKSSKDLQNVLYRLISLPTGYHRLFQSIIENINDKIELHQIDICMQWLVSSISPLIAISKKGKRNTYSRQSSVQTRRIKTEYPLINVFNSYMSKKMTDFQMRNFFMLMSFLTQTNFCIVYQEKWINEILHYAVNALVEGVFRCDLSVSTQLFLIISIDNLTAILNKTTEMEKRTEFLSTLKVLSENELHYYVYDRRNINTKSYVELQVSFCALSFLRQLSKGQQTNEMLEKEKATSDSVEATMNGADSTPNLKMSVDCLSVRNDYYDSHFWQSVRSKMCASKEVYYYEVTLLTSGLMRIGWATENSNLEKIAAIGEDEFSIAFEGFSGTVTNDAVQYEVANLKNCWKPGDVVGCLINFTKKKFSFYLNGEKMKYKRKYFKSVYFSSQPYYAAVSLFIHQQCAVNFGQEPFREPPKRIDYLDFHRTLSNRKIPVRVSYSIKEGNLCGLCKINIATFKFCKCDHWELCAKCVPKLTDCPICDN